MFPRRANWEARGKQQRDFFGGAKIYAHAILQLRAVRAKLERERSPVLQLPIATFVNGAKGHSALQRSRDPDVRYKTVFALSHKIREALAPEKGDLRYQRGRCGWRFLRRVREALELCREPPRSPTRNQSNGKRLRSRKERQAPQDIPLSKALAMTSATAAISRSSTFQSATRARAVAPADSARAPMGPHWSDPSLLV